MAEVSGQLNDSDESAIEVNDDSVATANSDFRWEGTANTALESRPPLSVAVYTETDGLMKPTDGGKDNRLKFALKHVNMFVDQKLTESDHVLRMFGKPHDDRVEWRSIAQVRIRKGTATDKIPQVVDAEVFEFDKFSYAEVTVKDPAVTHVVFEIRFIKQRWHQLPKFTDGDLILDFHDGGEPLYTYGALLALHSSHIAKYLNRAIESGFPVVIDMSPHERRSVTEVLYYIYETGRPLWSDFKALAEGAVAYGFDHIVQRLSAYVAKYEHFGFEQKMKEAIKLKLYSAVHSIAHEAEKNGLWLHLLNCGMDPKKEFGEDVYYGYICPAILQAKQSSNEDAPQGCFDQCSYDFSVPNQWTVPFVVQGHIMHINKGILSLHNDSQFGRGNNGEFFPRVTVALRSALEENDLQLFSVVEAMFHHIYPSKRRLRIEYVRPLLIFAHEHRMTMLKGDLEDMLIEEPPVTTEKLLDHLKLAEKYQLENLMSMTLASAEGIYREIGIKIVQTPQLTATLKDDTRKALADRLCSGWALSSHRLSKIIPTKNVRRVIGTEVAGPYIPDEQELLNTLIAADSQAAFGDVEDIVIR